jgi:hypothetical protein
MSEYVEAVSCGQAAAIRRHEELQDLPRSGEPLHLGSLYKKKQTMADRAKSGTVGIWEVGKDDSICAA